MGSSTIPLGPFPSKRLYISKPENTTIKPKKSDNNKKEDKDDKEESSKKDDKEKNNQKEKKNEDEKKETKDVKESILFGNKKVEKRNNKFSLFESSKQTTVDLEKDKAIKNLLKNIKH